MSRGEIDSINRRNRQWCKRGTHGEAVMKCARCHGSVVPEQTLDPHSTTERFESVRCLNCGNIEDAMIEANRNHHVRRLLP